MLRRLKRAGRPAGRAARKLRLEGLEPRVLLNVDLAPGDIGFSNSAPEVNEYIDIMADILNTGTEEVGSDFYVDFIVNGESLSAGQGFLISDPVPAGGSLTVNRSFQYTGAFPTVELVIDLYDDIVESAENNNEREETFSVPKSDFVITALSSNYDPAKHVQGTQVTFTAEVENVGDGGTIRDSKLKWYARRGLEWQELESQPVTTDYYVGTRETYEFQLTVDYDDTEVMAFIDADDQIDEINEWNNTRTTMISVPHPDLIVRDIWWEPRNPLDGEEVRFFAQIANIGDGGTTHPFDVRFIIDQAREGEEDGPGPLEEVDLGVVRVFTETYPHYRPSSVVGPWEEPFDNADFDSGTLTGWALGSGAALTGSGGGYLNFSGSSEARSPETAWPDYIAFDLREQGPTRDGQFRISLLDPDSGSTYPFWESHGSGEEGWARYEVNTSYNPFDLSRARILFEFDGTVEGTSIDLDNIEARFREQDGTVANVSLGTWTASPGSHTITAIADVGDEIDEVPSQNNTMTLAAVGENAVLSVDAGEIVEGDTGQQGMAFAVHLSRAMNRDVSFFYTTKDGTAVAGEDYVAQSGTITIPAYETATTFFVPILGDLEQEGQETFHLNLSGSAFAHIENWQVEGVIQDNDAARLVVTTAEDRETEAHYYDFFFVAEDTVQTQQFIIHNQGETDLTINELVLSGSAFSAVPVNVSGGEDNWTIPANGEMPVEVTFAPSGQGFFDGSLFLKTSDPYNGAYEILLAGAAEVAPAAVDDSVLLYENTSGRYVLDVLANDYDRPNEDGFILLHEIEQPPNGVVTMAFDSELQRYVLVYNVSDLTGTETFAYTIQDQYGLKDTAEVTVSIASPYASVELDQQTVRTVVIRDTNGSEVTVSARNITANIDVVGTKIDKKIGGGRAVITGSDLVVQNIFLPYSSHGRGSLILRSDADNGIVLENLSAHALQNILAPEITLTGTLQVQSLSHSITLGEIDTDATVLVNESDRPITINAERLEGRIATTTAAVKRIQLNSSKDGTINCRRIEQLLVREGDLDAYVSAQEDIRLVMAEEDIRKWIRADNIDKVMTRNGDLEGEITAQTGSIGTVMINGDINGQINADDTIHKIVTKTGVFSGTARAAGDIRLLQADTLNAALISAGGDVYTVAVEEDILDSYILGGYDIGIDLSFGLLFPSGGDLLSGGDVHRVTAGGLFADSYISAGVLPETERTQSLPAVGQAGATGGTVGKVVFGAIDMNADDYFGVVAATKIKHVQYGRTKVTGTVDELKFWAE